MELWLFNTPVPPATTRLNYGPDQCHFGDLRLPDGNGPHPVIIFIHGGFWRARYDLEHTGHLCAALTAEGVATWNIEYRRIGNGGGWPNTFLDVARAADHLRELAPSYNLDLNRVIVMGHSAGGHLALWLAGRAGLRVDSPLYQPDPLPLKAAVSLAGVTDLRRCYELNLSNGVATEFLGGSLDQYPDRYDAASPAALLPLGTRQVLVHGTEDVNVPFTLSEVYAEQAIAAGDQVELLTLPGAAHFEVIDPKAKEWPTISKAALSLL